MKKWPHTMGTYNHELVRRFCVEDASWQKVRLSMKGISTEQKLIVLDRYRSDMIACNDDILSHRHQVQIDNYLQALHRGGLIKRGEDGFFVVQR